MAVWQAAREGLKNFSMLVSHVLVPPAVRLLLGSARQSRAGLHRRRPRLRRHGLPEYETLARDFRVPFVVAGFEPLDLLKAILMLVRQLERAAPGGESVRPRRHPRGQHRRARAHGRSLRNLRPQVARHRHRSPARAIVCATEYAAFDAERRFQLAVRQRRGTRRMHRGDRAAGSRPPVDCPAFGTRCTPQKPLGAPMVSNEGACAAYYVYRREPYDHLPHSAARERSHSARPRVRRQTERRPVARRVPPRLSQPVLARLDDQAVLEVGGERLAFTTDSFVVKPLFFRGGDIGSLAVHGTVNDLAMGGAEPALPQRRLHDRRRACPSRPWRASPNPWAAPPKRPASRSSPATPRSSRGARATASSSTPPGSGACLRASNLSAANARARRPRAAQRIPGRSWHHDPLRAPGHRLRRARSPAIRRRCTRWSRAMLAASPPSAACAIPRAAASPAPLNEIAAQSRRSASSSTRPRSRCAKWCAAPASCSASIRSTSPTRANCVAIVAPE